MSQLNLDSVADFGGIDADNDPLLDRCFETHRAYIDARSHARTLILGRKGSGKTAIYRQFLKIADEDTSVLGHVFSDYPWHYHEKQKQTGVPVEHCYINSWEYLIYIGLAKILLSGSNDTGWSETAKVEAEVLRDFLTDTYGSTNPDIGKLFSPNTMIKAKGEVGFNAKFLSGKLSGEVIPIDYLPIIVSEINIRLKKLYFYAQILNIICSSASTNSILDLVLIKLSIRLNLPG